MADADHTSVLREATRLAMAGVHVAYPATVVSYDSASQKATVRIVPCFRRKDPAQDGVVTYRPPDIPGTPVAFPGAGAFSITWPLAAGDSGLLVVTSRSMDEWLANGGTETEPQDHRRHDLTDSVFLPGLRSFAASEVVPAQGLSASSMVLRGELLLGDATATEDVMLGTTYESQFRTWLAGFTTFLGSLNAAANIAAVVAAAAAFQPTHATFVGQMAAGHLATKAKAL